MKIDSVGYVEIFLIITVNPKKTGFVSNKVHKII